MKSDLHPLGGRAAREALGDGVHVAEVVRHVQRQVHCRVRHRDVRRVRRRVEERVVSVQPRVRHLNAKEMVRISEDQGGPEGDSQPESR